ncbi:MAG: hypothetical protein WC651_02855 [Candidatus Gracilibacteria bacterium]|jgi:hypothetical protein
MRLESTNSPDPRDYFEVPKEKGSYRGPSTPLQTQIGPGEEAIKLPDEEMELLAKYASWENNPPFDGPGRSGYVKRKEPLRTGSDTLYGYKLKGVGNFDERTRTISPPRGDSYQATWRTKDDSGRIIDEAPVILIHMGVSENGTLYPVLDPPKPIGGLAPRRGQREFQNAARLHAMGVPACLPVAWGRYPEIKWQDEPTEFVVLGLPSNVTERLGAYFEPDIIQNRIDVGRNMRKLIERRFDTYNPKRIEDPLLRTTKDIGENIGRVIRAGHDADVARFASHLGNFSFMPNNRNILLHDLDSSIRLGSIHPQARALTMIRDVESAIFGFMHSITHANIYWIVHNQGKFSGLNPFKALLKGYFRDDVDENVIEEASRKIFEMVVQLIKLRTEIPSAYNQRVWMESAIINLVPLCLREIFQIYEKSALNRTNTLPYGMGDLEINWQRFSRQKDEMYRKRVEEIMARQRS